MADQNEPQSIPPLPPQAGAMAQPGNDTMAVQRDLQLHQRAPLAERASALQAPVNPVAEPGQTILVGTSNGIAVHLSDQPRADLATTAHPPEATELAPPPEPAIVPPPAPEFAYPVIESGNGTLSVTGIVDGQAVRVTQRPNADVTLEVDLNGDNRFTNGEMLRNTDAVSRGYPSSIPTEVRAQIAREDARADNHLEAVTTLALQQGRVSPEELARLASYGYGHPAPAAGMQVSPEPTPDLSRATRTAGIE